MEPVPSLFDLGGRVSAVTGAGSGLGRAIAVGLARHGSDIALIGRNPDGLAETAAAVEQLGRRALAVRCDVTEPADVTRAFEATLAELGRLDILVNNAAITSHVLPEELEPDAWDAVLRTNVTGYWLCARSAFEPLKRAPGGGSIVNVSSTASVSAMGRGNFAYSVSKGAINQMTRELALEWAPHGIRVNAILPCQIWTPALRELVADPRFDNSALVDRFLAGIPLGRLGEPEDVVGPVVFLASGAAAMVTGALLPVDGGNLAFNAGGGWPPGSRPH
jgi:NAD(P)-dependent dehydrogenase (short-subunit alcohol dehydrogenase family)